MDPQMPNVLIIDENVSFWNAFVQTLQSDYHVIFAETEYQSTDILNVRDDINLILLSHNQPDGINALNVLEKMNDSERNIPVIVVTERDSADAAINAFKLGAKEHLYKPFQIEDLLVAMSNVLSSKEWEISPVGKALKYIESHYSQLISAKDVAQNIGFSSSYIGHLFKKDIGQSINTYICSLRIEKAKGLLTNQNMRIKEMAGKVGFRDQYYFSKVFKKTVGDAESETSIICSPKW